MVRGSLSDLGLDGLVETAELLVSEIVTNALVHAGTPIDVAVRVVEEGLRIEVGDGSPHLPSRRSYAPTAGTGRGLMLLEEMVDDWGVDADENGKTVWFLLSSNPSPEGTGTVHGTAVVADGRGDTVEVRLQNVPLLLHGAWHQHAEALLREYLLASLDVDTREDPIQVHAQASDAMSVLAEHLPSLDLGGDPQQLLEDAAEPHVSAALVLVPVPAGSVPHFATLGRAIEDAITLADRGELLTPPTQPELRSLRHWLCQQVLLQAEGGDPSPWSPSDLAPLPTSDAVTWDPTPVASADTPLIAVDDRNRILAVSRPALEILGYDDDDDDELVGQRIVVIIPPRFRQAHVAGFTMHFLTGRSPLIGNSVVVPAQRRDSSETLVDLTINAEHLSGGRKVFVADLHRHPA